MATLLEQVTLRRTPDFMARVEQAVANLALYILTTEPDTVANHALRRRWALLAVIEPAKYASQMMTAVVADVAIQANLANATDAQISYAIDATVVGFSRAILGLF